MDVEIKKPGMTCPTCGATVPPEDWFCRACGTVIVGGGAAGGGAAAGGVAAGGGAAGVSASGAAGGGEAQVTAALPGAAVAAGGAAGGSDVPGAGAARAAAGGVPDGGAARAAGSVLGAGAVRPAVSAPGARHARHMGSQAGGSQRGFAASAGAALSPSSPAAASGSGVRGGAASSGAAGTVRAGNVSAHYEPDPEPSPVPRILAGVAAVALALGVGWWVGGKRIPTLPWLPGSGTREPGAVAGVGSADEPSDPSGVSDTGDVPGVGQGSAASSGATEPGNLAAPGGDATDAAVSYELVSEAMSWEEAAAWCEEHGGTLAQPRTAEQLDEVLSLVDESGAWIAWVGATREAEGFAWLDGTAVSEELFAPGEPNDLNGIEDRLAILRADDGCGLFDVPSDLRAEYPADVFAFVIERPAE